MQVEIDYTNYRGERGTRVVTPIRMDFFESEYHKGDGPQWILVAYEVDRKVVREFAMKDIHSWKPI